MASLSLAFYMLEGVRWGYGVREVRRGTGSGTENEALAFLAWLTSLSFSLDFGTGREGVEGICSSRS